MEVYGRQAVDSILEETIDKLKADCEVIHVGKAFKAEEAVTELKRILTHFPDLVVIYFPTWMMQASHRSVGRILPSVLKDQRRE